MKPQTVKVLKALSSSKGATVKQLEARGIANPRAAISDLRNFGYNVRTASMRNSKAFKYSV